MCFLSITDNDKYTIIARDLFRPTTNATVDEQCNTTEPCCTLEYCDYSVKNQVEYFVNRRNIDRYVFTYLVYATTGKFFTVYDHKTNEQKPN